MKRIPKIVLFSGLIACTTGMQLSANAQNKTTAAAKETKMSDGFSRLATGLEYKIVKHGKGTRKPQIGDRIEMNIRLNVEDSVIFDSRKMNNNQPVPLPISEPKFPGDPMEGFMLMVAGDSALLRLPVDSLKKVGQLQPWMKEGQRIIYRVSLVTVRTEAEDKKYNEEKAAKQTVIDDKILKEYFEKNNLKPMKTASGLYYTISAPGAGENVKSGQKINVNYTGKFMDGKKFDSNTDPDFKHVQPFTLNVGTGSVIKGWDEGLQLLKIGSKATFYIPSALAYGSSERPNIPANSILVFDVEVVEAQDQAAIEDKQLQEYFAKNNIKATKTPSGMYYSFSQKGLGATAKPGKTVTMNYTGKLMDGTVFDSNTDPQFGHVAPFDFQLGAGRVIKGWDEGVQLLNIGSKATFYIPSALGYGERGAGGKIGPNAILIFDVELVGIAK